MVNNMQNDLKTKSRTQTIHDQWELLENIQKLVDKNKELVELYKAECEEMNRMMQIFQAIFDKTTCKKTKECVSEILKTKVLLND